MRAKFQGFNVGAIGEFNERITTALDLFPITN
jgi:hypothetical protein